MSEIPLRSYLREIENHIESGRLEQAIAHCRQILQVFPKCVDAYRLLAQSFLESQRYTDANDIFQRVLSTIPDDFVSHLGISLIRADEGNTDEAIWHMERAYEMQPSNGSVQEELRKLYSLRNQIAPPRIRLTRAALARLYDRGELYQLASSEIHASLADDPNRLDLQALLATIYLKMDQRVEAAETAVQVLRKLPNCLAANQVMSTILAGTDRTAELEEYRLRVSEVDPYQRYISSKNTTSSTVPEQSVLIEKLEWNNPSEEIGAPPDEIPISSFLQDEVQMPDQAATLQDTARHTAETAVPDWLMNTDWTAPAENSAGESQSLEAGLSTWQDRENVEDSQALPEWLQQAETTPERTPHIVEELDDWFAQADSSDLSPDPADLNQNPQANTFADEWLAGYEEESDKIPSFFSPEPNANDGVQESAGLEQKTPEEDGQIGEVRKTDWLDSLKQDFNNSSPESELESCEFDDLETPTEKPFPIEGFSAEIETQEAENLFDGPQDQNAGILFGNEEQAGKILADFDLQDTPDEWLSTGGDKMENNADSDFSNIDYPDWLKSDEPSAKAAETESEDPNEYHEIPEWLRKADAYQPTTEDSELPEWLIEDEQVQPSHVESEAETEFEHALEEGRGEDTTEDGDFQEPDEIGDTQPTQLEAEPASEKAPAAENEAEIPEISESAGEDETVEPEEAAPAPLEPEPANEADPLDEAFAWLMGLTHLTEKTPENPEETDFPDIASIREELLAENEQLHSEEENLRWLDRLSSGAQEIEDQIPEDDFSEGILINESQVASEVPAPATSLELEEARHALEAGDLVESMDLYALLIEAEDQLEEIAQDLEEAAKQFPDSAIIWQNLGDAYLRLERTHEALYCYGKSEKLRR